MSLAAYTDIKGWNQIAGSINCYSHRACALDSASDVDKNGSIQKRSSTSDAWGGAMQQGTGWYYVEGTVTVPYVSGQGSNYAVSAWVGIDGWSCNNAILQTGINIYGDGTLGGWTQWYPSPSKWYDTRLSFQAGDNIRMTVSASSATDGTTTLTNLRTGQTVTQQWYGMAPICGNTAEWIVEDFTGYDGYHVPLANFGSIPFYNTVASGNRGNVNAVGADIVNIVVNGRYKTDCGSNQNGVQCNYLN
ncbi:hypothetical protein VHEMI03123 [[Torrubiella] hemipterigena]|uniref:Peptidase A4 family protein n=1 Tax=[Torrubiella] hemipterigena TaxID=1531966 RepID=A0A0A1TA79_9HYPO|nr:hypothetical protein VHEMI03123 [[Torrubiella] hemipterigena]